MKYEVVKRGWVTGDRAKKVKDDIQVELELEIHPLMKLSGQRKFPGHGTLTTDSGVWKLRPSHISRGFKYNVHQCPMRYCGSEL